LEIGATERPFSISPQEHDTCSNMKLPVKANFRGNSHPFVSRTRYSQEHKIPPKYSKDTKKKRNYGNRGRLIPFKNASLFQDLSLPNHCCPKELQKTTIPQGVTFYLCIPFIGSISATIGVICGKSHDPQMTQIYADGKQGTDIRARRFQTQIRMSERP